MNPLYFFQRKLADLLPYPADTLPLPLSATIPLCFSINRVNNAYEIKSWSAAGR